ncbi:hypothetical protein C8Q76DRAFT_592175, partial [Earliella scabrosa]
LLRAYGAVISGSLALRFFLTQDTWEIGDMDVYVPDHKYEDFIAAITNPDGLAFRPQPPRSDRRGPSSSGTGIKEVRRYTTPSMQEVDVIRSPTRNAIVALHAFWSTLVMNFIAPDACCCAFPRGTLSRRGLLKN